MDKKWEAEKYSLSKITIGFLPRRMPVKDVTGDEIGYTGPDVGICIAYEHKIFSMLKSDEKRFFRKGVFAHELLHQIFTDFKYHEKVIKSLEDYEKPVFRLIANILEDPAIEYWAKTKFGGSLLKSLKYSIAHIYEQSPSISDSKTPFSQFINAFIQFGDMGLVKGEFTFPEAKEAFLNIAPLFNSGILEPSGKKRLDIAKEIMEKTRPLWEEEAKMKKEFEKILKELMESMGKEEMSGSGSGEDGDVDSAPEKEEKGERRKKTMTKISKSSPSPDSPSSETISGSKVSDDASEGEKKKEKGKEKTSEEEKKSEKRDGGSSASESGESSSSSDLSSKTSDSTSDSTSSSSSTPESSSSTSSSSTSSDSEKESEEESEEEILSKEKEITKEDKKEMKEEIEKAETEMKREEEEAKRDTSEIMSMDLKEGIYKVSASDIINIRVPSSRNTACYSSIVSEMATGISNASKQIRKMISFAQEETEYATKGRLNIKRLNCGKNTARVFDKKRVPNEVADLVIGVAVDLSGSMGGDRIENAKKCCIALAEICNNLNVPIYIMGFSGQLRGGREIYHEHYITWQNTKQDRTSLLNIRALAQNLDGPSFRYFTEIMRKKNSKHKLMIIVSDGTPAAYGYSGPKADDDTALAIKHARKVCDVLGVAVGNSDTKILHSFYGNDFLHVSQPSDLFAGISNKLKKFVHKWIENE